MEHEWNRRALKLLQTRYLRWRPSSFATMRSSVRSRLAPPNSDSMFSIVSTESHLVCTTFVQPRVFNRNSISPKRSEKDAVRLHPPLRDSTRNPFPNWAGTKPALIRPTKWRRRFLCLRRRKIFLKGAQVAPLVLPLAVSLGFLCIQLLRRYADNGQLPMNLSSTSVAFPKMAMRVPSIPSGETIRP
jgi:hypothetical protein